MRWYQRNAPAPQPVEERTGTGTQVVRRVEIIVERETCRMEFRHAGQPTEEGQSNEEGRCPVCGRALETESRDGPVDEVKRLE